LEVDAIVAIAPASAAAVEPPEQLVEESAEEPEVQLIEPPVAEPVIVAAVETTVVEKNVVVEPKREHGEGVRSWP